MTRRKVITEKTCRVCNETKKVEDMKPKRRLCNVCYKAKQQRWYLQNSERINGANLAEWHSMTPLEKHRCSITSKYKKSNEWFDELMKVQGEKCAICSTTNPGGTGSWHTDHDHDTGEVRGFLCALCNSGLGMFKDNCQSLENAISYLKSPPSRMCSPYIKPPVAEERYIACSRCGEEKERDAYNPTDLAAKVHWCKLCRKEYRARYYQQHKARELGQHKQWNADNAEQKAEVQKIWNQTHPEAIREAQRRHRRKKKGR